MKLKKIVLSNFRCFKDKQEITFDQDGKITLIYGLSGHGKSTILQFLKWMFYDENPTGSNNGSISLKSDNIGPLYNKVLFDSFKVDEIFNVEGVIEFTHDGVDYELSKQSRFKKNYSFGNFIGSNTILTYRKDNDSWVEFDGNPLKKINEIIPESLSRYFFFSGEQNVIENANDDLKSSIYRMFGLTKYQNALEHLGDKTIPHTVINKYEKEKAANKPTGLKGSASENFNNLTKANTAVVHFAAEKQKYEKNLSELNDQLEKKLVELGKLSSKIDYKAELKRLDSYMKTNVNNIGYKKEAIGEKIYTNIPYLLLGNQIHLTESILNDSAKNEKTYAELTKATLLDILAQGQCVCGNCLDDKMRKHINDVIDSMPPHSYNYTHSQFVKRMKRRIPLAKESYNQIENLMSEIAKLKAEYDDFDEQYKDYLKKLNKSDDTLKQQLSKDISDIRKSIAGFESMRNNASFNLQKYTNAKNYYQKAYDESYKFENIKEDYNDKIEILLAVKKKIENELRRLQIKTSNDLNNSIIEVYKKISTRTEDFTGKTFLNDDFTLRKEYKAGGQIVVDVFAYIIGMIKAISNMDGDDNESDFPVVIDAPFSHTDHYQMEHIVDVISSVVPQTTMLTLDIIRIKKSCDPNKFGHIWKIESNEEQTVSWIVKGEL